MMRDPFTLLHPHRDRVSVGWWSKRDDASCADAGRDLWTSQVAHLDQVHGGACVRVSAASDATIQADGLATDTHDLLLLSKSADCQTFVLYDPTHHAIAAAHAGWKGLLAQVLPHTVELMTQTWNTDPGDLLVCAAPSLGLCCAEFTDPTRELPGIDPQFFHGRHVDLQGIADEQLQQAGVWPDHIERMTLCTKCNRDLLWSYRAEPEQVKQNHRNLLGVILRRR